MADEITSEISQVFAARHRSQASVDDDEFWGDVLSESGGSRARVPENSSRRRENVSAMSSTGSGATLRVCIDFATFKSVGSESLWHERS
jgi:hypothetical protein